MKIVELIPRAWGRVTGERRPDSNLCPVRAQGLALGLGRPPGLEDRHESYTDGTPFRIV